VTRIDETLERREKNNRAMIRHFQYPHLLRLL
jgi:hypothetical protein